MARNRYDPKLCEQIVEYFERQAEAPIRDLAPTSKEEDSRHGQKNTREFRHICAELPTLQGFACEIKIPSSTLRSWAKDHEEFGEAYDRCKDIQYRLLVDRGLTGQYNPQAFIFAAQNMTDMRDKRELTGEGGVPLQATLILVDAGQPSVSVPRGTIPAERVPLLLSEK